jgi:hypothetical protein
MAVAHAAVLPNAPQQRALLISGQAPTIHLPL